MKRSAKKSASGLVVPAIWGIRQSVVRQLLEAMDYWAGIQMNMWSDDTNVLDAIEANLRAARAARRALLSQG